MRRGNGQPLLRGADLTISVSDDIVNGRQKKLFPCLLKAFVERDSDLFTVGTREGKKNVIQAGLFRLWLRVHSPLVNNLAQLVECVGGLVNDSALQFRNDIVPTEK